MVFFQHEHFLLFQLHMAVTGSGYLIVFEESRKSWILSAPQAGFLSSGSQRNKKNESPFTMSLQTVPRFSFSTVKHQEKLGSPPVPTQVWVHLCEEERVRGQDARVWSQTQALPPLTSQLQKEKKWSVGDGAGAHDLRYSLLPLLLFHYWPLSIPKLHHLFFLWTLRGLVRVFSKKLLSPQLQVLTESSSSPALDQYHSWPSPYVSLFHILDSTTEKVHVFIAWLLLLESQGYWLIPCCIPST